MKPLMQCLKKSGESDTSFIRECVADFFNTSDAERNELLPSGKARVYDNRIAWAISYLKMANLLES